MASDLVVSVSAAIPVELDQGQIESEVRALAILIDTREHQQSQFQSLIVKFNPRHALGFHGIIWIFVY